MGFHSHKSNGVLPRSTMYPLINPPYIYNMHERRPERSETQRNAAKCSDAARSVVAYRRAIRGLSPKRMQEFEIVTAARQLSGCSIARPLRWNALCQLLSL